MIVFNPIWPWSYLAAGAAIFAFLSVFLRFTLDWYRDQSWWMSLGGNRKTRIAVLCCSFFASSFLAAAALNPLWTEKPADNGYHLQVAVDVSTSVLRAYGGWEQVRKDAHRIIESGVKILPGTLKHKCTAGIVTFRNNTNRALKRGPLKNLPSAFLQLDSDDFASGNGSNLENGLKRAASLLEKAGGSGAILLISDGNQTSGDAMVVAGGLARQGIPVHVLPVTSRGPAVAITDANLPGQVHTGVQTFVRGMMLNRMPENMGARLSLSMTGEKRTGKGEQNTAISAKKAVELPSGQWVRFRWPVVFEEFGLQFLDLTLSTETGREPHLRRFFTYANRPPRILSIGGDNRWVAAISADVAEIIPVEPEKTILPDHLKDIDAVVINSTPAAQIPVQSMISIAGAVDLDGKGLLLINGDHAGAKEVDETVIMSFKDTVLGKILPVVGGPRPFIDEPPPRQVAILIDTSGSMAGWKLNKSKQIAKHIVSELLRPQDRLDLITFTTGAGHLLNNRNMNETGKKDALRLIDSIRAWGGTDPRRALSLIGSRKMVECGLIFISDGEFGYINYRPDCRATAFEIGSSRYSRSSALKQFADPIPVDAGFDPQAITIPYFEPKPRDKFFEAGTFTPQSMGNHLPRSQRLPIPELELAGSAVCYLKEGAILNGVRPKLTDPVLVYGDVGSGCVGVFTSGIPRRWSRLTESRKALEAWLGRLVPFMDRDRYNFRLTDYGRTIHFRIAMTAESNRIPDVNRMAANLYFPGQETIGIVLQSDDTAPGTFFGEIPVNRLEKTRRAVLAVREFGSDALPGEQRIPIMIPPKRRVSASSTAEDYTYGQNRELLRRIAEVGGGLFDPPKETPLFKRRQLVHRGHPLWSLLLVLAAFCYLGAIAFKRWNP